MSWQFTNSTTSFLSLANATTADYASRFNGTVGAGYEAVMQREIANMLPSDIGTVEILMANTGTCERSHARVRFRLLTAVRWRLRHQSADHVDPGQSATAILAWCHHHLVRRHLHQADN
jgi:hypothetical protein